MSIANTINLSTFRLRSSLERVSMEQIMTVPELVLTFNINDRDFFIPKIVPSGLYRNIVDSNVEHRFEGGALILNISYKQGVPFEGKSFSTIFNRMFNFTEIRKYKVDDILFYIGQGMILYGDGNPLLITGTERSKGLSINKTFIDKSVFTQTLPTKLSAFIKNTLLKEFTTIGYVEIHDLKAFVVATQGIEDVPSAAFEQRVLHNMRKNAENLFYII